MDSDSDGDFDPRGRNIGQRGRTRVSALRRKFTPQEDATLTRLVKIHGARRWDDIAREMPGRTGRQCRDRFKNYLQPELVNGVWTEAEDRLLRQKVEEHGLHWSTIAKEFPGRSQSNLKNRWYSHLTRSSSKDDNITEKMNGNQSEQQSQCIIVGDERAILTKPGKNRYVFVPRDPDNHKRKVPTSSVIAMMTWNDQDDRSVDVEEH